MWRTHNRYCYLILLCVVGYCYVRLRCVIKLPLLPLKSAPRSCLFTDAQFTPSLFPIFVYEEFVVEAVFVTVESAPKASIIRSLSHWIKMEELRFQSAKYKSIVSLMRMVKVIKTCVAREVFIELWYNSSRDYVAYRECNFNLTNCLTIIFARFAKFYF